jgi:hypothetical protein
MGKINLNNYELFVIDYLDGNLNEELSVELELFVMNNPQLDISLNDFPILDNINYSEPHNINLHKSPHDLVSEEQFILYVDNSLPLKEKEFIDISCSHNPELKKELNYFKRTKLFADTDIIFPDKNKLKRSATIIFLSQFNQAYRIAASVLFLLGVFIFSKQYTFNEAKEKYSYNVTNTPYNQENQTQINEMQKEIAISNNILAKKEVYTKIKSRDAINHKSSEISTTDLKINEPSVIKTDSTNKQTELLVQIENPSTVHSITVLAEEPDIFNEATKLNPKKGFWDIARNALKKLNSYGVKSVNGNEEILPNNKSYELTLGSMNIQHKKSH